MSRGGSEWLGRLLLVAAALALSLLLLTLALVYGTQALDLAYLAAIGDPALSATATAATLLLGVMLVWLVVRGVLRRQRGRAVAAQDDLLDEGIALARRHPWLAAGCALAAGFAVSGSEAADSLIANAVARQLRDAG